MTFLKILGSYPKSDPAQPFRIEKEKMRMDRDCSGGGHERWDGRPVEHADEQEENARKSLKSGICGCLVECSLKSSRDG